MSGERINRGARWMTGLALSSLVLSLSSSEAQSPLTHVNVDTETQSSAETLTRDSLGSSAAQPSDVSSDMATPTESPEQTIAPSTADRECRAGMPASVSWPDMDFVDAPIELIGDTPDGSAMAAPKGRDFNGFYDTVGFYKYSPEPGSESGTPVLAIHATSKDPSLIYPRDERVAELQQLLDNSGSTTISVTQDNGSECVYEVDEDSGMELAVDKLDRRIGYSAVMSSWYSLERGIEHEKLILLFCIGEYSVKTGSSDNIVMLRGEPIN